MKAQIGFGRCNIPSADGPSYSKPKSVHTVSMHQLLANSWKYTCLRMMDRLHHFIMTSKVLKGLSQVDIKIVEFFMVNITLLTLYLYFQ